MEKGIQLTSHPVQWFDSPPPLQKAKEPNVRDSSTGVSIALRSDETEFSIRQGHVERASENLIVNNLRNTRT
jgi:hypothetical protein